MNNNDRHYTDVLVIGSGIAGLSAAITLAEQGLDVIVITKESTLDFRPHLGHSHMAFHLLTAEPLLQ